MIRVCTKRIQELAVGRIGALGLTAVDDVHEDYTEIEGDRRLGNTRFQIVDKSHTKLFLSRLLQDAKDGFYKLLLLGPQVIEKITLGRWWKILFIFAIT